ESETLGGRNLPKTTITQTITSGSESSGFLLVSENVVNLRGQTLLSRSPDVDGDGNPEVSTYDREVITRTNTSTGADGVTHVSTSYADGQRHSSVSMYDNEAITPLEMYDYTLHNLKGGGLKTTLTQSGA